MRQEEEHDFARVAFGALDDITDFAAVLSADGNVLYVNPHAEILLGVPLADARGTSFVDWLHPEDLERAVIAISRMAEDGLGVPVTPAFYRLRRADQTWCRIELNATVVETPDGDDSHLFVYGRYSGDHDLQDQVMDLLTSEAPADEAIALVPEFGHWRHADVDYAVFFLDDDGRPKATGSKLITELGGLDTDDSPWAAAAGSGDPIVASVHELNPEFTERARARGITHVWGVPVADPLHDTHAVVAFARIDGGADTEVHGYALDVMAKILQLILLWRHQVISLRRAAQLDPLTGVANRAGFWDVLESLESSTDDAGSRVLGVLYVDLDGFKAVNDQHGHSVGDLVLAEVAARLNHVVRPGDLIARIGGDEFAVVADGVTRDDDASAIAERIVKSLCEPYEVAGHTLSLGASVGAATVAADDFDPDRLLDEADRALYRAKADGRGRWHLVTGGTTS